MARSTTYPVHDLGESTSRLERLMKNTGFGPFTRQSAVIGMGYKGLSGISGRGFSALQQYGLVSKVNADNYKISDLGKRILKPVDEQDRINDMAIAASLPKLFSRLNELFIDGSVPDKLDNYLINQPEFKFSNSRAASEAAANYKSNVELVRNGVRSGESIGGDQMRIDNLDFHNLMELLTDVGQDTEILANYLQVSA
jgi:hypothetical protein